jgi:hypothetical protein
VHVAWPQDAALDIAKLVEPTSPGFQVG